MKYLSICVQIARPENRIKCTLIPGDGVGPELVYSVQEVFKVGSIQIIVIAYGSDNHT